VWADFAPPALVGVSECGMSVGVTDKCTQLEQGSERCILLQPPRTNDMDARKRPRPVLSVSKNLRTERLVQVLRVGEWVERPGPTMLQVFGLANIFTDHPVDAGIVRYPEEYLYSSAGNYARLKETVMEVRLI
jgi:hypothetical protein